ncbi:ABC transporter permease [Paenibacillaceae bacterium]|nr:ABC transporter permease [Paenibacillaceae bacterium]
MIQSIVQKELLLVLKDKGSFFWLFVLPVAFIVIFSSIFGSAGSSQTYKINYYDADQTAQSQQFIATLQAVPGFELVTNTDDELDKQLVRIKDGKQSSLLVIPAGYEEQLSSGAAAEVELYRDAADDAAAAPVAAVLEGVAKGYQEMKLKAGLQELLQSDEQVNALLAPSLVVKEIKENAQTADPSAQITPGYTVMFVFFIMITMISNFMRERNSGMLSRLQGTPMKAYHYLIGMWIPNIIVVVIQSTVLLTFGKLVYGLEIGNVFAIGSLVIALAICATGMGLMLSMLVSSENMGIALVQVIAMGGAIVGGLWFPYEFLPKVIQTIGQFTPQYWALRGMQDVIVRGATIGGVWMHLAILLGFGLICLLIASLRFRNFAGKAAS